MPDHQTLRSELMRRFGFGPEAMNKIKVCRICGCACDAQERHCVKCGALLPRGTLLDVYKAYHLCCPACGTVVADGTKFCPKCGKPLVLPAPDNTAAYRAERKPQGRFRHILHPFAARKNLHHTDER